MSSPLAALVRAYDQQVAWTLDRPYLGLPGVERHAFDPTLLPAPSLVDIHSQTKFPHVLGVEIATAGKLTFLPLLAPMPPGGGADLARSLVRSGVHPLDVVIATLNLATIEGRVPRRDMPPAWTFRSAVDWLFWTHDDQDQLDRELAAG